ncbi:hypothetical protein OS175_04945 [Marinicella sp. S1101]|uniref:choice-of-anchor Q domain-containing protein n=1 Tax=Marinicella marina TaxID=2996016 RepID=UPI002260E188|nr:choice-of-anchor Q domain-containing protein [Marinicella marina]MCX7553214.1 hypothetical protein [Marinicella marina]MDJ1138946.1 choice-of-anchor Q domain-containing protein [Marinicella marina]
MKKLPLMILLVISLNTDANLLVVDSNQDVIQVDGNCTLREAITAANFDITVDQCGTGFGDDLIWVLLGTSGDAIQLSNQLGITDGVEIQGPGADQLVLFPSNDHTGHVFQINTNRDVVLKDFRIGGAQASAVDVVNVDELDVDGVRFLNNTAGGSGTFGGAIHADTDSGDTLSINRLTVINSQFINNSAGAGGAMAISGAFPVSITDVVFDNNSALIGGGALFRQNNSREVFNTSLNITNSQFLNNSSNTIGGAITLDLGFMNIDRSLFHNNQGQSVLYISRSVTEIENSLLAENPVNEVILHRNFSNSPDPTEMTLAFNTFLDNQNLDIENNGSGGSLATYLLANVFDSAQLNNCQGPGTVSLGFNVERLGATCAIGGSDYFGTDPELLPLGLYDGDVLIAPPSPISPLIDAAGSQCNDFDLSGIGRPRNGDAVGTATCDIGAVERPNAHLLSLVTAGNGSGQINLDEFAMVCYTPDDCDWPLQQNLSYTLQPIADSGSQFTGWSGACNGTGNCQVTMDSAKNVTAEFTALINTVSLDLQTFQTENFQSVTVTSDPAGIECGNTCAFEFEANEAVTLTANPAGNTIVDYWDGCDLESNDGLECTVFLGNNDQTVQIYLDTNTDVIFVSNFD